MTRVGREVALELLEAEKTYKQRALRKKIFRYTAIGLDVLGAGILAYGYYENNNVVKHTKDKSVEKVDGIDRTNMNDGHEAERAATRRNTNALSGGNDTMKVGETITVLAVEGDGYKFTHWSSSGAAGAATFKDSSSRATNVSLTANTTIIANFAPGANKGAGVPGQTGGGGSGTFIDARDNQVYKKVTIGDQTWMVENLNKTTDESWCYGEGGTEAWVVAEQSYRSLTDAEVQGYCKNYGRLYTWSAAKAACPSGWHLPSRQEWVDLAIAAGGTGTYGTGGTAGAALKADSGWYNYNTGASQGNGLDSHGFSALPGGFHNTSGGFYYVGSDGNWWTASEKGSYAYSRGMYYLNDYVSENYYDKGNGFSVRCVENE